MTTVRNGNFKITIDGEEIEYVQEFTFHRVAGLSKQGMQLRNKASNHTGSHNNGECESSMEKQGH